MRERTRAGPHDAFLVRGVVRDPPSHAHVHDADVSLGRGGSLKDIVEFHGVVTLVV